MTTQLSAAVMLMCAVSSLAYLTEKPDFLQTCYFKDPNFDDCSRDTVQKIFGKLKDGFPEVGIIPLDPLNVTEIRILQGTEGPVTLNATLNDVKVTGLGQAKIMSNKMDRKTYNYVTKMRIPRLRIEGQYNLNGRILVLPLVGKGSAWFEPVDMDVVSLTEVTLLDRDGRKFFSIKDVHVDFEIGSLSLRLNNLYNGRKALEESTNTYINANWRAVSESLKPIMKKTIEDILYSILKPLYDNTPAQFFVGELAASN